MVAIANPSQACASCEETTRLNPPRVLLAEDDDDIRRLIATALQVDGYSVIEAKDGAELLEHLRSALLFGELGDEVDSIDLVISDIRMPGYTGLELLGGLRDADIAVAVILMTAYGDEKTRERAKTLGADAFVNKPFEIDMLRRTVHDLVRPGSPGG